MKELCGACQSQRTHDLKCANVVGREYDGVETPALFVDVVPVWRSVVWTSSQPHGTVARRAHVDAADRTGVVGGGRPSGVNVANVSAA